MASGTAPRSPGDATPPALLVVERLTTSFPAGGRLVPAVNDISFSVGRGETLGLVGESGCGKSLTALSILRLVPPPGRIVGGAIRLEGRDLMALSESDMAEVRGSRIGLVFQEPATALNPVFTIGDQIAETLRVHGVATRQAARARTVELLADVSIPDPERRASEYPHQLSGGLRQRAMIAMALACQPALLIADEPTTALDATIQAQILDLLKDLKARHHLSVLLITHDLGVIAQQADRVAVMYAGRIVEQGPARQILRAPAHPYTRGLLTSIPGGAAGSRLQAIEGVVPTPERVGPGCAFAPRCLERFDRCDVEVPEMLAIGPAHDARCHLHDPQRNDVSAILAPQTNHRGPGADLP